LGLRRYYRRRFGRHARFHFACLLTIVVVTYLLVPWIVSVIDAGRAYSPFYYEPKDFTRQDFIVQHGVGRPPPSPWKTVVNVVLVFAVVVVWLTVIPRGGARR
jgi:hypothetical protein